MQQVCNFTMWHSVLTTILLISQVTAGVINDASQLVRREKIEDLVRRYVDDLVEPVEKRQSPAPINITQWDADTFNACELSLETLNGVATNPSGLAVCYNLPMLNNDTGVFQADLRLFKVSEPTGAFAGIASQNVQVGLSYIGATVSAVNSSSLNRRDGDPSTLAVLGSQGMGRRQNVVKPVMLQAYAFVGQINADVLKSNQGTAGLQEVLVPTVSLTGTDSTGKLVNTTLSSQEATFVSGIFSTPVTPTISEVEAPIQTLVVASGKPFVMPGLNILIFPIGAIITGTWAILLVTTIGYGTYGRMQFREDYRRRAARAAKAGIARI